MYVFTSGRIFVKFADSQTAEHFYVVDATHRPEALAEMRADAKAFAADVRNRDAHYVIVEYRGEQYPEDSMRGNWKREDFMFTRKNGWVSKKKYERAKND